MRSLEGRVALVTGAARGQGAAEARLLAQEGARVVVADIRDDEADATARSIPGARAVHLDISRESDWASAVALIDREYGRLDILVNNAAIAHFGTIEETSLDDFNKVQSVNLSGVFLGMRSTVGLMKKTGGSIVNVSSIAALCGRRTLAAYGSSKWGVRGLSKTAALEFAPYKIRVNTVFPGLIDTLMIRDVYGAERIAARGAQIPVGRNGEPDDIANVVLFLASDASAFCNGAEFIADGGETAGM